MTDMSPFSVKVRRSLLQRRLMLGIPTEGIVLLIVLSAVFVYVLSMYFMIAVVAGLYALMRFFTAKDPWMIDIVLASIMQKDLFIP